MVTAADLHVHSTCSADGESSIADHARQAARLGLAEVGFCEHADFDARDRSYGTLDLARYDRELAEARAMVPGVELRQGVEITFQAGLVATIRPWLAAHRWDYVVTSVHLVDYADGWAIISDPTATDAYFRDHSQRQAYLPYFEELLRAVLSGLGDVLGHLDLVKRYGADVYGPFEPAAFEEEIRAVLQAMVERGMALEVNTSGLRQPPGEPYPALTVLRWYRELGGELLTLGSDAHHTHHLGAGLAEGAALARAAGFSAVVTFEGRRPHLVDPDRLEAQAAGGAPEGNLARGGQHKEVQPYALHPPTP
jgi:histidinol-phosphatase (PHP family)